MSCYLCLLALALCVSVTLGTTEERDDSRLPDTSLTAVSSLYMYPHDDLDTFEFANLPRVQHRIRKRGFFRNAWRGVKKVGKAVGTGVVRGAKEVGSAIKKGAKVVGKAVVKGGKAVYRGVVSEKGQKITNAISKVNKVVGFGCCMGAVVPCCVATKVVDGATYVLKKVQKHANKKKAKAQGKAQLETSLRHIAGFDNDVLDLDDSLSNSYSQASGRQARRDTEDLPLDDLAALLPYQSLLSEHPGYTVVPWPSHYKQYGAGHIGHDLDDLRALHCTLVQTVLPLCRHDSNQHTNLQRITTATRYLFHTATRSVPMTTPLSRRSLSCPKPQFGQRRGPCLISPNSKTSSWFSPYHPCPDLTPRSVLRALCRRYQYTTLTRLGKVLVRLTGDTVMMYSHQFPRQHTHVVMEMLTHQ